MPIPSIDGLRVFGLNGDFLRIQDVQPENQNPQNIESVVTNGPNKIIKYQHHSSDTGIEVVPIVAIVFVFLWLIVKALMAPFTQRATKRAQGYPDSAQVLSEEEQAVLVKLQRTIVQMERRIESLETILIDEHRTKEKYGNKI